jgi:hypothetical protein
MSRVRAALASAAAFLAALLLPTARAAALCPNCLGQSPEPSATIRLVGLFLLVPPAVFVVTVLAIRRLSRQSTAPSAPPSLGSGGDQAG